MILRSCVAVAAFAIVATSAAVAQTAPAPPPGAPQALPRRTLDSAFALGAAYREIGRAEQAGASGHYLDAAKTHYRSAIDRHGRNDDAGASAEARLASDLARVAVDERPANAPTGPRDIPAPPTPRAIAGRPGDGTPGMPAPAGAAMERAMRIVGPDGPLGHESMMRVMGGDGFSMHGGFDATSLAQVLKVETGAEARQLAQNAVDANTAAQKAALAGNVAEASRQTRIANDLAAAVHDLAAVNHPELRRNGEMRIFRNVNVETRP